MKRKVYYLYYLSFLFTLMQQYCFAKEVVFQGSSTLKQIKFIVESGDLVFSEKYQNLNGKITQEWFINGVNETKDEYFKKMAQAEAEEKELARKEQERKRQEEEIKTQKI